MREVKNSYGHLGQSRLHETMALEAVTVYSQSSLLEDIQEHVTQRRGFAVATLNLDHAVKLQRSPTFRKAYASHTHVTADGRPIVWLTHLAARPVELVTGSDLVKPLACLCANLGIPIALVGSTPTVLYEASARLRYHHPTLEVALTLSPPMGFDPEGTAADHLIAELSRSGARVCFLALGAPKQEIFAAKAFQALPDVGFVSVGAGIDFLSGTQIRAPRLIRALALEWLWRLLCNPRRLFLRYIRCAAILPALTRHAIFLRNAQNKRGK